MTKPKVRIEIREVGQKFAEIAVVMKDAQRIFETNEVPYGHGANAARWAVDWAKEHGFEVEGESGVPVALPVGRCVHIPEGDRTDTEVAIIKRDGHGGKHARRFLLCERCAKKFAKHWSSFDPGWGEPA